MATSEVVGQELIAKLVEEVPEMGIPRGHFFTMNAQPVLLGLLSTHDPDLLKNKDLPIEQRIKMLFRSLTREISSRKDRISRMQALIKVKEQNIKYLEWQLAKMQAKLWECQNKGANNDRISSGNGE